MFPRLSDVKSIEGDDSSNGSNNTAEMFKNLDDTLEEGKQDLNEGNGMLKEVNMGDASKKRSHDDAKQPSGVAGLSAFAPNDDPIHVIRLLPKNLQEDILSRSPPRAQMDALCFHLNQHLHKLEPSKHTIVLSQPTLMEQVELLHTMLTAKEEEY